MEIIRLDTRVYTKVKSGASLNLDLSDSDFDPSLYNAISDSKLFSNLEIYMKGGVYGWRNREFAATQSTTLEYPLWEGYFVPKLENFSINASRGEMDIELDISNKLFFDAKIGMNFYERNKHDSQFTELAGSMHLCDYTKPPGKKDTYNLQMKKRINLPSSKEYEARITVEFDAPGGPYTIETDVKTTFIESYIMITTSKARGETISLGISVDQVNWSNVWIDLNNNGVKDEGERVTKFTLGDQYTIQSQTFSIYGIVTSLSCSNNKITSLDISGNTSLTSLYCNDNELTTLDVSDCTELRYLYCSNNQLTSLDVSNDTALVILDCYNTSLTSLDLSGNTAFEYLTCYNTPLTSIDVSGCTKLKTLLCYDSQLTSLDISGCTELVDVKCYNNQLTSLDASSCISLEELRCQNNNLTSLDVSGCTNLSLLRCYENGLLGIRPAIFDNIRYLSYDTRYSYRWDRKEEKYVMSYDSEIGYWYEHEPAGGCHKPEPCN